jgi:hypothetical protein
MLLSKSTVGTNGGGNIGPGGDRELQQLAEDALVGSFAHF